MAITVTGGGTQIQGERVPSWIRASALAGGLALGIFLLYFLMYPLRHLSLPVGFDPPWYVWRAERLTAVGVGTGDVAARPGYPVLSAILGSLTGLSQLGTTVVLSLVVVALLALAVGAFAREGLGLGRRQWIVVVATTGVVLGPTHLVGENLSNALNIALEIGAMAALLGFVGGRRGMAAAVVLLVASGMAHWDFAALFAVVMAVAFVMALPSSTRAREQGVAAVRTQSGALAALGLWAGSILMVTVGAVLRAPVRTIEIGNDELLFRRKFRTDVARLFVAGIAGLIGPWTLPELRRREPSSYVWTGQQRSFAVRFLRAWTYVMAVGMVVGLLSFAVPPARFLAHLVAFPGAITVGLCIAAVAAWISGRGRRLVSVGVTVILLVALAIPGLLRWYRYPVLLEPAAVQQARTAGRYVRDLPASQPVVFLIGYGGRPGSLSAVLKERTVRMGLSPERQPAAHIFVGSLADLLRGRRTPAPDERAEQFTRRYWNDVRLILPAKPPVVVVRAMAEDAYEEAVAMGAEVVAPNVAVLRGPGPHGVIQAASPPDEVPSLWAGMLYGLVALVLLWAAGVGWTRTLLGPGLAPETAAAMAPVVGAAVLMVGGLAAALLGVRLGRGGAVACFLVVSLSGLAWAIVERDRHRAENPPATNAASSSTPLSG